LTLAGIFNIVIGTAIANKNQIKKETQ